MFEKLPVSFNELQPKYIGAQPTPPYAGIRSFHSGSALLLGVQPLLAAPGSSLGCSHSPDTSALAE